MPKKGKLPEWEKDENKRHLFKLILAKPSSFKELLKQTRFSTATLSKHLDTLEKQKLIEKAIEKGRIVYRATLNEEALLSEIKAMSFEMLIGILSYIEPNLAKIWETLPKALTKEIIYFKKRELEGKPPLSAKELMIQTLQIIQSVQSPEIRKITNIDETLELLKQKPDSEFQKLEEMRKALTRKLRREEHEG